MAENITKLKRELEENQKKHHCGKETQLSLVAVSYLPKDCVFNTIVRLPLESIHASMFVCKIWYGIVNSPSFIHAHLKRSDTGLVFLTPVRNCLPSAKTIFSVESKVSELLSLPVHQWPLIDPPRLYYMKFIEIKDGKSTVKEYNTSCMGNIRATCNGLIILEHHTKSGGLVLMNTVTRELKPIPLGTRSSPHQESYGLAFCHVLGVYKLVHLFLDKLRYVECEIMDIGNGSWRWRAVDGPAFGVFGWLGYQPVFTIGALHWIPNIDVNEYMVSLALDDEKFVKTPLPSSCGIHDRIIEMSCFLGFVTRQDTDRIIVWILRSLSDGVWEQQYTISVESSWQSMVPLYCKGIYGEIIFRCKDDDLYVYDYCLQLVRKVEDEKQRSLPLANHCYPHVNSLISWKIKAEE
ncbi:F-box/kelch-repeat protein At3g06240-like [Andrographis paniculata]|uniref:F-box/kelch-repeat protein At3g06240-like n=1 Tax=Andrographis paniculata TaxID=175694 RepID=UPI0021E98ECC|nr:F-box/kelch-repeat protein At3g06240-like [Andrographis paniculata]